MRLELEQEDIASYERAAEFLNYNGNDLVCLQHEYGIYGGNAGRYILALLRRLKMPLVTTLHTVLREPDPNQRIVLEEIAQLSDRLIVMSELAAQLLREVYSVPSGKIDVIPHGVPEMHFMDPNYFKDHFGTEGKSVLLTFGLLSPNKGIENVIRALPAILALGAGKAIISSPYWHAKELLTEKRGVIVPFDRPDAIAESVLALLENDAERHAMRKRAYLYSRGTTWPKTARAYMASFQRARFERSRA